MMGVGPYLGISFTMYDELQQLIPDDRASRNSPWYALAKMGTGITAGLTAHTVVYPLDTLRRRMQVRDAKDSQCCLGAALAGGWHACPASWALAEPCCSHIQACSAQTAAAMCWVAAEGCLLVSACRLARQSDCNNAHCI